MKNKTKLKKGDLVKVIAGKHQGLESPIMKFNKQRDRVHLEGINLIKHVKPDQKNQEGGILQVPAYIHISNVALLDSKKKKTITKIFYDFKDGKKIRMTRKSKTKLA